MSVRAKALYASLMREAYRIPAYNFREYAKRRVRDAFKANKEVTDPAQLSDLFAKAEVSLGILQRQAVLGNLYPPEKMSVVEAAKRHAAGQ